MVRIGSVRLPDRRLCVTRGAFPLRIVHALDRPVIHRRLAAKSRPWPVFHGLDDCWVRERVGGSVKETICRIPQVLTISLVSNIISEVLTS